jgi:WD40 repeat protein
MDKSQFTMMIRRFFLPVLVVLSISMGIEAQNAPPDYSMPDFVLEPGSSVYDVAYSPDGTTLASASGQVVTLWDTARGDVLQTLPTENNVRRVAITPEGSRIIAAVEPDQLYVWDVYNNYSSDITSFPYEIIDFAVAPNANTLALILDQGDGNYSRIVGMSDLTALRSGNVELRELSANVDKLGDWSSLEFDPTGRYLAVGVWHPMPNTGYETPDEASVYIWDTHQNSAPRRYYAEFEAPITDVQFSSDGTSLLAGSWTLLNWNVANGEMAYHVLDGVDETGLAVGGDFVASAEMTLMPESELERARTRVTLRNWETGETLARFQREGPPLQMDGFSGGPYNLIRVPIAMRSDGTQLAIVDRDGVISLWNLENLITAELENSVNIVAYCDQMNQNPPIVTATQPVTILWSWYAVTIPQVWDHRASAIYEVALDGQAITYYSASPIRRDHANDNHWTVYYRANVGTLEAGVHTITYRVTWRNPISDGLAEFGPGSAEEENTGQCQFTVQ